MTQNSDPIDVWIKQMPGVSSLPFSPDPPALYTVAELYAGYKPDVPKSWQDAWDTHVYEWTLNSGKPRDLLPNEVVATRLHDASMDLLVRAFVKDSSASPTIGFMGGHDILRTDVAYARVANIARLLRRRSFKIVTGGGPGLMEAANLGAFLAPYPDEAFDHAMSILRTAPRSGGDPDKQKSLEQKTDWVATAAKVRAELLEKWNDPTKAGGESLGIPTWFYGSEPPNLFASSSGKYFMNSLREDGLVSIADGGLLFGAGSAGTVQEVFQNATYNYYRASDVAATPMVFLDIDFWNPGPSTDAAAGWPLDAKRKPVFPLIQKLAADAGTPFLDSLMLSNDPEAIAEFLSSKNANRQAPRHADLRLSAVLGVAPISRR